MIHKKITKIKLKKKIDDCKIHKCKCSKEINLLRELVRKNEMDLLKNSNKNSKKKIKQKGGNDLNLEKRKTLYLLNTLGKLAINIPSNKYQVIDEIKNKYLEAPQSCIYKYDGNNVYNITSLGSELIETKKATGNNIILFLSNLGKCRGIVIQTTDAIYVGHLDSTSPQLLQTVFNSLSLEKITKIYYIMGKISFEELLSPDSDNKFKVKDISIEFLKITTKKNLNNKITVIKDFAPLGQTSSLGFNIKNLLNPFMIFT